LFDYKKQCLDLDPNFTKIKLRIQLLGFEALLGIADCRLKGFASMNSKGFSSINFSSIRALEADIFSTFKPVRHFDSGTKI
jgi:hypothetical protein